MIEKIVAAFLKVWWIYLIVSLLFLINYLAEKNSKTSKIEIAKDKNGKIKGSIYNGKYIFETLIHNDEIKDFFMWKVDEINKTLIANYNTDWVFKPKRKYRSIINEVVNFLDKK